MGWGRCFGMTPLCCCGNGLRDHATRASLDWPTAMVNPRQRPGATSGGQGWLSFDAAAERHSKHSVLWVMTRPCARAEAHGTFLVGCVTGARLRVRCTACALSATSVAVRLRWRGQNREFGRPVRPRSGKAHVFWTRKSAIDAPKCTFVAGVRKFCPRRCLSVPDGSDFYPRGTAASDLLHCADVLLLRAEIVLLSRSQM
jgi:hypothetical protein